MRSKAMFGFALCGVAACLILAFVFILGSSQKKAQAQSPAGKSGADSTRLINSIEGPNLYRAYCAVCHGSEGKANGPMANALKVRPSDLTLIAVHNGGKFPMDRIEKIISGEVALPSGHGTREMPIWGPIFSQVDRDQDLGRVRIDNLARYLAEMQVK